MADDQFIAPSGAAGAAAPRLPRPTRVRNKQPADQQVRLLGVFLLWRRNARAFLPFVAGGRRH